MGEGMMYQERFKAKSETPWGKPKGTLESEIRIAISVLEQRAKLVRAGHVECCITNGSKQKARPKGVILKVR